MTMTAMRVRLGLIAALVVALAPGCRGTGARRAAASVVGHRPVQELQPPPATIDPSRAGVAAPVACFSLVEKHDAFGGAAQYLPTSDELELADDKGGKQRRFVYSQATAGSCAASDTLKASPVAAAIIWSPKSCAHLVRGPILSAWERKGGARGALGYPITDELPIAEGGIRQLFEGGEAIWTPAGGVILKPQ